jgi:ADP-ribose pyrophosphatase YjhB (NUDIX family)
LRCAACGFVYYFNPAIATAGFVRGPGERVLFIRRAKEPGRGMLSIPGGFVDIGETAEEALRRELREEVNVEVDGLEFLCTRPNAYHYQEITYPVLDLFFVCRASDASAAAALEDVESFCWLDAARVNPEGIAFPSVREGLRDFVARFG